jgi:hypothetical protein
LSTGGHDQTKWIDVVLYSGAQRNFNFTKIQEAVMGFLISVKAGRPDEHPPVKAQTSGKYLDLSWGGLKIRALKQPYSEQATLVLK